MSLNDVIRAPSLSANISWILSMYCASFPPNWLIFQKYLGMSSDDRSTDSNQIIQIHDTISFYALCLNEWKRGNGKEKKDYFGKPTRYKIKNVVGNIDNLIFIVKVTFSLSDPFLVSFCLNFI